MQSSVQTDPVPISIFDVDRTITRLPTYSAFLIFAALRLKPWRLALLPLLVPWLLAYATGLTTRKRLKSWMHRVALGRQLHRRHAERIADAFAERLFRTGLYEEALARLKSDRAAGRRVMLATAAPELYTQPLAKRLGITDVIATRCRWANDQLDSAIEGDNCYGAAKQTMIAAHLAQQGIDRSRAHIRAYTDHASDLPLLEWADEPIAVNASPRLCQIAEARGWLLLDWKAAERSHRTGVANARRLPA